MLVTLELIWPPNPESIGPSGSDTTQFPVSSHFFSILSVISRHLLQTAKEVNAGHVQLPVEHVCPTSCSALSRTLKIPL